MKIFGKRKRPSAAENAPASVRDQSSECEAKAAVLELLKQDPSSWNAKQRRLVKRMRKREELNEESLLAVKSVGYEEVVSISDTGCVKEAEGSDRMFEKSREMSSSESVSKVDETQSMMAQEQHASDDNKQNGKIVFMESEAPSSLVDVVAQLNSKLRRKLMRQYERTGDLNATLFEAQKLISSAPNGIDSEPHRSIPQTIFSNKNEAVVPASSPSKSKRRPKSADWSSLPSEERLRREEQRRLQEEAAKRRLQMTVDGDSAAEKSFRHPLNSERRRANRRKPKHVSRKNAAQHDKSNAKGSHHDTSGFLMRKSLKST